MCLAIGMLFVTGKSIVKNVVIVGGGITGLAAAYHLQTKAPKNQLNWHLVESSARLGGKIQSLRERGFTIEAGPDSFMVKKSPLLDLCRSLSLDSELINASRAGIFVLNQSRLDPLPEGVTMMAPTKIRPFLQSRLLSWPGKIRMGMEMFVPRKASVGDESLGSFVRRRLGQEALDKIAAPLLAGIHNVDPDRLSLQSTFPLFLEMERKYGSLTRGFRAQQKRTPTTQPQTERKPASPFLSLRGGMQVLVDAIVSGLAPECLSLNAPVRSLSRTHSESYTIMLADGARLNANSVLLTTPAYVTADLIENFDPGLSEQLRNIPYSSTANVSLGFKREDIPHSLNGTGFVVPCKENRSLTACTWSSVKFEGRAPEGSVLLRVFLGGGRGTNLTRLNDKDLTNLALSELRSIMKITAPPVFAKAFRWIKGAPQYEVGHASRMCEIDRMASSYPGLYLAGAAYHGGGVPDCVRSGIEQAEKIIDNLDRERNDEALVAQLEWRQS